MKNRIIFLALQALLLFSYKSFAQVTLLPSGHTMCIGSDIQYKAVFSGGYIPPVTPTWSITSGSAVTINSDGLVTGVLAGTATIALSVGGAGVVATTGVTVIAGSGPGAISGSRFLCPGATKTLTGTAGATWSSSNTSYVTIDASTGEMNGASIGTASHGTATISYTESGGCYSTTEVTLNPIVSLLPYLCIGAKADFLTDATTGGGTWSSSNTSIATAAYVSAVAGEITGIALGTAIVSYTHPDGCSRTYTMQVGIPDLTLTPSTLCAGGSTGLATHAFFPTTNGWTSSDEGVATIGGSSGVITPISAGTAIITYTPSSNTNEHSSSPCYKTALLTVLGTPAAIGGPSEVCVGSTISLTNTAAGGTWSSSDPSKATVDETTGVVTGVAAGTTVVTYSNGCGSPATKEITVRPLPAAITGTTSFCVGATSDLDCTTEGGSWYSGTPSVATVDVSTGLVTGVAAGTTLVSYVLPTGCMRTVIITVLTTPSSITGSSTVCAGATITFSSSPSGGTWTSSDPATASVDPSSGAVTGEAVGTAYITYTLGTGCYKTKQITVTYSGYPITASPNQHNICTSNTIQLSVASGAGGGTWSSSNDDIATVNSSGLVTASPTATGSVTITFTSTSTGCYAIYNLEIHARPTISGTTTLCAGAVTTLTGTESGGTWVSGTLGVATIVQATGVLTAGAAGTANITYTLFALNNASDNTRACWVTVPFTVNPNPNAISGIHTCIGNSTTFSSTPGGGAWSSSNTSVATVNSSTGVVTGVSIGTAISISYILPTGCYATRSLNIYQLTVGGVDVCTGRTSTFTKTGTPAGTWTNSGSWSSSNTSLATVTSGGIVSGLAAGSVNITFTTNTSNGTSCSSVYASTILQSPAAITGTTSMCGTGNTVTLSDATAGGTWSSASPTHISVDASTGVVTGNVVSTKDILYTVSNGCYTSTPVAVNPIPTSFSVPTKCVGQTATLSTPTPTGGTWSSSNTSIATMSSNVMTAVAAGTCTITYTSPAGCIRTATATINPPCGGRMAYGTTGVNELSEQPFGISPNPTHGDITIRQNVANNDAVNVRIIDYTGRVVYEKATKFAGQEAHIKLNNPIPGIYFVEIRNLDGNISSYKLLVQ